MNSRKSVVSNIDFHRASFVKHLRSKKLVENIEKNDMIIPEWLFQKPVEKKIKKIYKPNPLRQLA